MKSFYCEVHQDQELAELHINWNQAKKFNVDSSTGLFYCIKCKIPYRMELPAIKVKTVKGKKAKFINLTRINSDVIMITKTGQIQDVPLHLQQSVSKVTSN